MSEPTAPSESVTDPSRAPERTREADRSGRPRGRPALVSREQVLEQIASLGRESDGLFRIHLRHPALYARARRFFGSWAEAVRLAGVDYDAAIHAARVMSRDALRKLPRNDGPRAFDRKP